MVGVFLISFGSGVYWERYWSDVRRRRFRAASHPALQIRFAHSAANGITVVSRPAESPSRRATLSLMRNGKTVMIDAGTKESWDQFALGSAGDSVFVLLRIYDIDDRYEFSRMAHLRLPGLEDDLESYSFETLFTRADLEAGGSETWIEEIAGVSPDGERVLLTQAFLVEETDHSKLWAYRYVVYDIAANAFETVAFEAVEMTPVMERKASP